MLGNFDKEINNGNGCRNSGSSGHNPQGNSQEELLRTAHLAGGAGPHRAERLRQEGCEHRCGVASSSRQGRLRRDDGR